MAFPSSRPVAGGGVDHPRLAHTNSTNPTTVVPVSALPRQMIVVSGSTLPMPLLRQHINAVLRQFPEATSRYGMKCMAEAVLQVLSQISFAAEKDARAKGHKVVTPLELTALIGRVRFGIAPHGEPSETATDTGLVCTSWLEAKGSTHCEMLVGYVMVPDIPWPLGEPEPFSNIRKSDSYVMQTGQEWNALESAAADGRTGANFFNDKPSGARIHQVKGHQHFVRLTLTPQEQEEGADLVALERLTAAQDADCIFALLYISEALAPSAPMRTGMYAGGWISLDDVMKKIGWDPRSTNERERMRWALWQYILFGARAHVVGKRTVDYFDKVTNEKISTQIEMPLWTFLGQQRPAQTNLFLSLETPLSVEMVLSKEWERLITNPDTAQFLPLGELLGAIPGNKAAGAWARAVGLSLAGFWRRHPREALDGSIQPTRGELLTRFLPKVAAPSDVLRSNPRRAVTYWHAQLKCLVDAGFVAHEGEAARTLSDMKKALPRYDCGPGWLKEAVTLRPGPRMLGPVEACANNLPVMRARQLTARRRGRPRKSAAQ